MISNFIFNVVKLRPIFNCQPSAGSRPNGFGRADRLTLFVEIVILPARLWRELVEV